MKKILLVLVILFLGLTSFAGTPAIRADYTGARVSSAFDSLWVEFINVAAPTSSAIVFYADNILGYASIDFNVTGVSAGTAVTTISAQAIYSNGNPVTASQTITLGTPLTAIKSAFYKFTLPAGAVTRNVSMNFVIKN